MNVRFKSAVLLGLVLAAVSASAFQEDKPGGARFYNEQSQERVQQQQAFSGKMGVVGSVPESTADKAPSGSLNSSDAGDSFSNADSGKATKAMVAATKRVDEAKSQGSPFGLVAIIFGVLIGLALVAKTYLDKSVPVPRSLSSS
ncbi:MAG: hypothetical protein JST30_16780 [Armatimonadetes bacterium]|nr:hypothetical protein [Armatimonadota bacterium]